MSKIKNKGLGRGLEALLPTNVTDVTFGATEKIQNIPLKKITPNKEQPRKHFDEVALNELATSIKKHGVIQPIIVTQQKGFYVLIAGERRWRAAQIARLTAIPAVVRSMKQLEELEIALIENVQRVDLSPLEQAASIERLHQQFSLGYAEIAKRLGKAVSTVNNIVRLLQLPQAAREALGKGLISEGHARAILALKGQEDKQKLLLNNIVQHQWSVRQAEQFVTASKQNKEDDSKKHIQHHMAATTPQTKSLQHTLGAKVTLRRTAKGGRLEIHFKDDTQLEEVFKKLNLDKD